MPIKRHLNALGVAAQLASAIAGSATSTGLTATGSTQATAFVLGGSLGAFGTVSASTGTMLPQADPGDSVFIYNGGLQTLSVYGQLGESITTGAANAAFSVAANKGCFFIKVAPTQWGVNLSA